MRSWVSILVQQTATGCGSAPVTTGHAILGINEHHPDGWTKYEAFHAIPRRPAPLPAASRPTIPRGPDEDEARPGGSFVPQIQWGKRHNPFPPMLSVETQRAAIERARFGPLGATMKRVEDERERLAKAETQATRARRQAVKEEAFEAERRRVLEEAGMGEDDPPPKTCAQRRSALDFSRPFLSVERYRYCPFENTVWSVGGLSHHDLNAYQDLWPDWHKQPLRHKRQILASKPLPIPDATAGKLVGMCFDASRTGAARRFSMVGAGVRYGGNCISWIYDVLRVVGVHFDWNLYGWSFVSPLRALERGSLYFADAEESVRSHRRPSSSWQRYVW